MTLEEALREAHEALQRHHDLCMESDLHGDEDVTIDETVKLAESYRRVEEAIALVAKVAALDSLERCIESLRRGGESISEMRDRLRREAEEGK